MLSNRVSKICTKCKLRKLFNNFSYNPKTKDCKNSWCKVCTNIAIKKYKEINKVKIQNDNKLYFQKNKNRIYKYRNLRYKDLYNIKLLYCIKSQIDRALKGNKSINILNLLGCSIQELKIHLEKQFKPGMNWSNHSLKGWHIDHIKPCAKFDLNNPKEQAKCFHYSNLQPLWALDNLKKSDKYDTI